MKKYICSLSILLIAAIFVLPEIAYGQATPKIVPTTPEAAALIKMTEYPVGMTTGIPDINIPLFEVKAGDLTLPLTLQYQAGGFKINEQSTRVGLGWSLSTDLQVTRTINGLDDFAFNGYINNSKVRTVPYPFYSTTTSFPSQNAYDIASGAIDGAPDKFSYKLLTKSGSFFFWQNNAGTYTFIPVPYDNVKITFLNDQFVITDTDGTVYYFAEKEATGENSSPTGGICMNCQVTAWKCTRIVSNLGNQEITFTYLPKAVRTYKTNTDCIEYYSGYYYIGSEFGAYYYRSDLYPLSSQTSYNGTPFPLYSISNPKYIEYYANGQTPLLHVPYYNSSTKSFVDKTYLYQANTQVTNPYNSSSDVKGSSINTIKFRGGSITFNNPDKLTQIDIKDDKNVSVKTIQLYQSYKVPTYLDGAKYYNGSDFQGTMYLDSLRIGNNGQNYETYALVYNNKYCFGNHLTGHDAWGYVNDYTREIKMTTYYSMPGKTLNERYYLDMNGTVVNNVPFSMSGYDWALSPREDYMKYGVLRRIVYPTGGYVDFDFEANKHDGFNYYIAHYKYGTVRCKPLQLAGGLRIRSINFYNPNEAKPATQKYYKYGAYENGAGDLMYSMPTDTAGKTYKPGAVDVTKYVVNLKSPCVGGVCTRNQAYPFSSTCRFFPE